jgi:hypothetical protein
MSIDVEELEKHINESLEDENLEADVDVEEEQTDFDIDEALNSAEPIDLTGKISDEDAEAKATERGWSKDGVDKYGHRISAIEFLERTPFFKKMDLMRGDIDRVNKQVEKLAKQNQQIAQKSIEDKKKLVEGFKAEKARILSGDYIDESGINDLKAIDEKIDAIDVEEAPNADKQIAEDYDIAKKEFKKANEWYETNRAMTIVADKVGTEWAIDYLNKYGEIPPPEETFNYALEEVKKEFPDLGKPKRPTRVNSPAGRTTTPTSKKKVSLSDIPEDARAIALEVMEATGQSEEDYLSTYKF